MSTIWTFDGIENKHDVYRGDNDMNNFCESLREHAMKIINFEKKKIIPLKNKRNHIKRQKSAVFAKKNIVTLMIKIIIKLKTIVIIIVIIKDHYYICDYQMTIVITKDRVRNGHCQ